MNWRAPVSSRFHCCQLTTRVGLGGFLEVGERLVCWETADSWWTLSPYVIPLFLLLDEWWLPGQRSLSHSEDKHWKAVGTFQPSHPLYPKTRTISVGDRGPSQDCHRGHRDIIRDLTFITTSLFTFSSVKDGLRGLWSKYNNQENSKLVWQFHGKPTAWHMTQPALCRKPSGCWCKPSRSWKLSTRNHLYLLLLHLKRNILIL